MWSIPPIYICWPLIRKRVEKSVLENWPPDFFRSPMGTSAFMSRSVARSSVPAVLATTEEVKGRSFKIVKRFNSWAVRMILLMRNEFTTSEKSPGEFISFIINLSNECAKLTIFTIFVRKGKKEFFLKMIVKQ
jgi:hypothetical protein